jgi:DNA-binding NtrC family response regulator
MQREQKFTAVHRSPIGIERPDVAVNLVTRSVPFRRALDEISRLAQNDEVPVVLEGESGTGKTTIAHWIHVASRRKAGQFQRVDLSTVDEALASATLFGHTAGAFTDARSPRAGAFVSAAGGTVFLDEIGKASKSIQQKLLHAVEAKEIQPVGSDRMIRVNVRVIVASNVRLEELVLQGLFLPDLFARLKCFRVWLPPLRERRADIPVLVEQSIMAHAPGSGYSAPPMVSPELMRAFQNARWPFNVRELDNAVQRLLVDAGGAQVLMLHHCSESLAPLRAAAEHKQRLTPERIEAAIKQAGGVAQAARMLGVDRGTLHRHRRAYISLSGKPVEPRRDVSAE